MQIDIAQLTRQVKSTILNLQDYPTLLPGGVGGGVAEVVEERFLVALSGGADSVALLRVMLSLGYCVDAVHCNFHLRGEESNRDEEFCVDLCQTLGVELHRIHFDTREYAALHKVSIEMAARELRYRYFEQLRRDINAVGICVAHHRDDQTETVLLNLLRGTGLEGLKGMDSQNGYILRPLLGVTRSQIINYLSSIKQDYITDSSNLEADVLRNKLRLEIIPMLSSVNAAASENIVRTAEHVAEGLKVFNHALNESKGRVMTETADGCSISIEKLQEEASAEYVLWHILRDYGFSGAQVEQIAINLEAPTGTLFSSASYQLLFNRGEIIVGKKSTDDFHPLIIPESGTYRLNDTKRIRISDVSVDDGFEVSRKANIVTLDAAKVTFPLNLRLAKAGDSIVPFGMKGRKLVSDMLTDMKVDLLEKQKQLVLEDAKGEIIWLVNRRPSNLTAITKTTSRALVIEI